MIYVRLHFKDFAVVEGHKEDQTSDNANFTNLSLLNPEIQLIILVVFNRIEIILVLKSGRNWEMTVKNIITLVSASL